MTSQHTDQSTIKNVFHVLGYGTRKEERELVDELLKRYHLPRTGLENLAHLIYQRPGFEDFFLALLSEVRPFCQMLIEVYELLNSLAVTAGRRASTVHVRRERAS